MLFSKEEKNQYVLGYDLGDRVSQISFLSTDSDRPRTLSTLTGAEEYNIPTLLAKRRGTGQWFYGKEALRYQGEEGVLVFDRLLERARGGEQVWVEDREISAQALLTLFIKRSLSLLSMELETRLGAWSIGAIMFTSRDLDEDLVRVLREIGGGLSIEEDRIFCQSYEESFFYYMLFQTEVPLRTHTLAFAYDLGYLDFYDMEYRRAGGKEPEVFWVGRESFPELHLTDRIFPEEEGERSRLFDRMDREFLRILKKKTKEGPGGVTYLLGDGFSGGWQKSSLDFLCRSGRVFQGNNLFSKGASLAARERRQPSFSREDRVFLGPDTLGFSLVMGLKRRGEVSYLSLSEPGQKWHELDRSLEVVLRFREEIENREEKGLFFELRPLGRGEVRRLFLPLEGLSLGPAGQSRIGIHIEMERQSRLRILATDLGFGDFQRAGGEQWEGEFDV